MHTRFSKLDLILTSILIITFVPLSLWTYSSEQFYPLPMIMLLIGSAFVIYESVRHCSPIIGFVLGGVIPLLILGPSLFFPLYQETEGLLFSIPLGCLIGFIISTICLIAKKGIKALSTKLKYGFLLSVVFLICLITIGPNMMTGIFALMMWGIIVGIMPVFLFFEIHHIVKREKKISFPFVKGISLSALFGVIVLYFLNKQCTSGESCLVFVGLAPFILVGFIVVGVMVAWFYKWRTKPQLREK